MPANVDSMFSVREMPWHGEGVVLGDYPGSWAEARKLAGLDWEPVSEAIYSLGGVNCDGSAYYEQVEGYKRILHSQTKETLAVRQDSFEVIDNTQMGEIIEAVLGTSDSILWETAGSLERGKSVWALVKLDEPIELPGDNSITMPYLAITNRHGGAYAGATLRATCVRIVCANTFRISEMEGSRTGATFSFVHRPGWRDRIEEARQAITGARKEIAAYRELAQDLLGITVTERQRELFIAEFVPMPPAGLITDRVVANVEQARSAIRAIIASPTTAPVAHTAYGLVQAAGEYLDHVRAARSWETRLNRTLLRPEPLKAKALTLVRQVCAA